MIFPKRNPDSHKNQNRRVLVVGGNKIFHGAPILAALGAERSGVDLIRVFVSPIHRIVTQIASENFIVRDFQKNYFTEFDIPEILEIAKTCDVLLLGNGIGDREETEKAILLLLSQIEIPVVIDAQGLFPEILEIQKKSKWTITPHTREFERIFGKIPSSQNIREFADKFNLTIVVKGKIDFIADEFDFYENKTGVPQMTVGGTGDALSGIIAGFIAQKLSPFQACVLACYAWGKTGEILAEKKFSFSARDLLEILPVVLKKI